MSMEAIDELLAEIEPLAYAERCRRLSSHGRELAGRPDLPELLLPELLDGLAERGQYERFVGLLLAVAAKNLPHITRAISDPDPDISAYAVKRAVQLDLADDALAQLVRDGSTAARAVAYQAIRRGERRALAERLIEEVWRRWGDREAAALLQACGPETVRARLGDLAHAVRGWSALAGRHPDVVLDHAERVLADLPRSLRPAWWSRHRPGVVAASRHAPQRVLSLLEHYWSAEVAADCVGRLLDADPEATLALFGKPERRALLGDLIGRRAVRRRLARLPDAALGALGRELRRAGSWTLANVLRTVAPSRRATVFDLAMAGVDREHTVLDVAVLDLLPLPRRAAEARRMLGLREIATFPYSVLETTSLLPYGEAEPTLRAETRRSQAEDRALGYRLLIACAGRGRDPEIVTALLNSLDRLRNEQDPVRLAALSALADLPSSLFETVHLPALERLADDALAARDCSHQTRQTLTRLATGLSAQGALRQDQDLLESALRILQRLTAHLGTLSLRDLPRSQEPVLVERLAPYLAAEADRDHHKLAFRLAATLGRRGHELPVLRQAVERALTSVSEADARTAITYWLAPPRTRGERAARLLAADPSTVTLDDVFTAIAWTRTDLLAVALREPAPVGRFAKPGVRQVHYAPPAAVRRWTAGQREDYLRLVRRVADNEALPMADRAAAVRAMGEIPAIEAGKLGPYLRSSEALLRRAALTALPWTARPQEVLADLLAQASGDDAHVAVAGAKRAALYAPPAFLVAALDPVLSGGRISARKEAVRLLARHRAPGAVDLLRRLWDTEGQHPSVRAAIAASALDLLDDPRTWPLLSASVAGGSEPAAPVLATHPLSIAGGLRRPYAELVAEAVRSADAETRWAAVGVLGRWAPFSPGAVTRLAALAGDLAELSVWSAAARGLVSSACSGSGVAELRATVRRLAAAPDEPAAQPERDRPAAQRLAAIVADLRGQPREDAREVIDAIADALPADLEAELLAATVDWAEATETLARLVGRSAGGVLATMAAGAALARSAGGVEAELVLPHARRLAGQGETGGLLAAAVVAECGPESGWSAPWRELLLRLRASDSTEVAYVASRTHTAPE